MISFDKGSVSFSFRFSSLNKWLLLTAKLVVLALMVTACYCGDNPDVKGGAEMFCIVLFAMALACIAKDDWNEPTAPAV